MCTNFMLIFPGAASGSLMRVSTRTLELSGRLSSRWYQVPRNQQFPLRSPFKPWLKNPLEWTNRYGFVGIGSPETMPVLPAFMDGMNEVGLSAAALWLPGTKYPTEDTHPQVAYADLPGWILGTCATVAEVLARLEEISVWGPPVGTRDLYLPLHFIASDPSGESVIIELVDGQRKVYGPEWNDHATSDGVLTNAPTYDWHRANLANYANLTVVGPETSVTSVGPPVGNGLCGMPGDPMSASRFVRAALMRKGFEMLPASGEGWIPAPLGKGHAGAVQTAINVAMQLSVVVMATPYGTVLTQKPGADGPSVGDWTMWAVARDHTHRALYYTTAFNGIMRCINLAALRFDGGRPFPFESIPLLPEPPESPWVENVTNQLTMS
jgi:choloylglycine hydrolase